jgi:hypothetical protein
MNDDLMKQAMAQARELQQKFADALRESEKLRETLFEQARASADLTQEQTQSALDNLNATLRSGSEFLQRFMRGPSSGPE